MTITRLILLVMAAVVIWFAFKLLVNRTRG